MSKCRKLYGKQSRNSSSSLQSMLLCRKVVYNGSQCTSCLLLFFFLINQKTKHKHKGDHLEKERSGLAAKK